MRSRRVFPLMAALTLLATTPALTTSTARRASPVVLRVGNGTPGREVRFRGVLLVQGQPMRLIEQTTPWEFRSDADLVLAAFEPRNRGPLLRLELISDYPMPAVVTAPRVMVGQRGGGLATEFAQSY